LVVYWCSLLSYYMYHICVSCSISLHFMVSIYVCASPRVSSVSSGSKDSNLSGTDILNEDWQLSRVTFDSTSSSSAKMANQGKANESKSLLDFLKKELQPQNQSFMHARHCNCSQQRETVQARGRHCRARAFRSGVRFPLHHRARALRGNVHHCLFLLGVSGRAAAWISGSKLRSHQN